MPRLPARCQLNRHDPRCDSDLCHPACPTPSRPRPPDLRLAPPLPQLQDLTDLQEGAAALHELYTSFTAAGFSDDHAFRLVLVAFNYCLEGGTGGVD